jgi:hypothetical protein
LLRYGLICPAIPTNWETPGVCCASTYGARFSPFVTSSLQQAVRCKTTAGCYAFWWMAPTSPLHRFCATRAYPPPSVGAIAAAGWPKGQTILGRGLLALQIRCGAEDRADGVRASWASITSASHPREYHHLFPDSLLREAGLEKEKIFRSANCALLTWRTNRVISNKDPVAYLRERSEQNTLGEAELKRRLQTHLIPFDELAVGYAELDESDRLAKIRLDYDRFLQARANLLAVAARLAVDGQPIDYSDIFRLQADGAQQSV